MCLLVTTAAVNGGVSAASEEGEGVGPVSSRVLPDPLHRID